MPARLYGRTIEIDHIVSLELGGSNDIANLYPEPGSGRANYHVKDELENKLHDLVCSGAMTLRAAQRGIATQLGGALQARLRRSPVRLTGVSSLALWGRYCNSRVGGLRVPARAALSADTRRRGSRVGQAAPRGEPTGTSGQRAVRGAAICRKGRCHRRTCREDGGRGRSSNTWPLPDRQDGGGGRRGNAGSPSANLSCRPGSDDAIRECEATINAAGSTAITAPRHRGSCTCTDLLNAAP